MENDDHIAAHDAPVAPADFLIHVDLTDHGMPGKLEQLWARRVSERQFQVASLPFFPYGIALGDVVETRGTADPDLVVARVVTRSGHRLLRVALSAPQTTPELHETLHRELVRSTLKFEWRRVEYVAVDLPTAESGEELLAFLEPLARMRKLSFEVE